jgi:Mrp family chromosome partitioning ATPase
MSKHFELLQRVSKDDLFDPPKETVQPTQKTSTPEPLNDVTLEQACPRTLPKNGAPEPEINKLVQRLFSRAGEVTGPRIVSLSGMTEDDRNSWICARTGEALAEQSGKSVCMVDADFWSPRLHLHFSAANSAGLAGALATKISIQNFALPVSGENLWLVPAGLVKPGFNPSVERYRERFTELRDAFDYVLINGPAIGRETQTTLIGQLVDGVVLIVKANRSRREAVRRAKEQLERAHVHLLGAVLDQRTFPIPEKLYRKL